MNLAEAIKNHGSVIGAVGVAVLTFTVANPGCTYDQIAEGLSMGRSTVIRYIHQLESLSLIARTVQKNDLGLDLATSIKSGVSLVDTSIPQRDTVESRAPINTGVPQRDTDKNGYPAGIHRESAPLHPHKDILNTNTLYPKKQGRGAKAPTEKKTKKSESQKDPRTKFPAIAAFFSITGKYPKLKLYDSVIEVLGAHPDLQKMRQCYREWLERGYNEHSLKWLTVWYVEGIPPQAFKVLNGGNNAKSGNDQQESRNIKQQRENYERFGMAGKTPPVVPDSDGVQGGVPVRPSDGRRDGTPHKFMASGYSARAY